MTAPIPSTAKVERLRRGAKKLAREHDIPLNAAQDRLAVGLGFSNWSLMVKTINRVQRVDAAETVGKTLMTPEERVEKAKWLTAHASEKTVSAVLGQTAADVTNHYLPQTLNQASEGRVNLLNEIFPMTSANSGLEDGEDLVVPRMAACPRCGDLESVDTEEHPGTCYVRCAACGLIGPEVMPNRDRPNWKKRTLRAIVMGWNDRSQRGSAARTPNPAS